MVVLERSSIRGGWCCLPSISALLQFILLRLKSFQAGAKLLQRPRQMAILAIAVEPKALGPLPLQQGQLYVVGEEEELLGAAHLGGGALVSRAAAMIRGAEVACWFIEPLCLCISPAMYALLAARARTMGLIVMLGDDEPVGPGG